MTFVCSQPSTPAQANNETGAGRHYLSPGIYSYPIQHNRPPRGGWGNPLGRPRGANRLRPPTSYLYLVDFPSTYRHLRALLHLICMEPSSLDNFLVLPTAQVAVNTASYTPCRGPTPLLPSPGLSSLRFCSSSHHPVSRLSRPDSRQLISLHPSHVAPFLVALFSLSRPRRFSSRRPCLRHPDSHPPAFVVTILIERPDSRLLPSHYPNSCRTDPCRADPRRQSRSSRRLQPTFRPRFTPSTTSDL